jgi:hypothetical protein
MSEVFDTKETKEALIAIIGITEFLVERLSDGVRFDDVLAIYSKLTSDDVFMKKIKNGFEGIDKVTKELKELSTEEIAILGYEIAPQMIAILAKLKKS